MKTIAENIRMELKNMGYTNKQIGVRQARGGAIRVTIKDIKIPQRKVEAAVKQYERISRDAYGEILAGGNLFVTVDYDYNIIREAKKEYIDKAAEIIEKHKKVPALTGVQIASNAAYTALYWPAPSTGMAYVSVDADRRLACGEDSMGEALALFAAQYGLEF